MKISLTSSEFSASIFFTMGKSERNEKQAGQKRRNIYQQVKKKLFANRKKNPLKTRIQ